jgi:hypothetical protein
MLKYRLVFLVEKEPPTRAKYLFKWGQTACGRIVLERLVDGNNF